jgi:hypothetical protein
VTVVTKARLVVPGETYAMNGVISVKTAQTSEDEPLPIKEKSIALFKAWAILGTLFIGAYLVGYNVLGACIIILLLLVSWSILASKKKIPKYSIILRTSSGEVKTLESQDSEFIQQVNQALSQAIIARG